MNEFETGMKEGEAAFRERSSAKASAEWALNNADDGRGEDDA